jgi:hypothetical protein
MGAAAEQPEHPLPADSTKNRKKVKMKKEQRGGDKERQ